ncbi:MAG TPA: hypothetical protein VGN09_20645 [Vicinamibacteria bacterium]
MSGASSSIVVLLLLASCSTSPTTPRAVSLDDRFTLAPGQTAEVGGTGLRVTFEEVSADSRCPVEVTCVWEGDAVAVFLLRPASAAVRHELHTSGRYPSEVPVGDYRVRLVELAPRPRSGASPAPADYRATLLVTPR